MLIMRSSMLIKKLNVLFLFILLISLNAWAQTGAVRARVSEAVDMHNLVTLRGNVHPLARPELTKAWRLMTCPCGACCWSCNAGRTRKLLCGNCLMPSK